MKPRTACFWVVGNSVAIDLHAENGELIRPTEFNEPAIFPLPPSGSKEEAVARAEKRARLYALEHGIDSSQVHYDDDSTDWTPADAPSQPWE